jgi:23S rRNA (cytidine1920-2'-O)/16S rRNA (cytidine1409-2'-O)-methyltransferase
VPFTQKQIKETLRYVSRGGLKLEKALEEFHIQVAGRVCLDVGASTGGFTDCLLQHEAAFVHAVDVGYGQFDWKLRQDKRVSVQERTHILDVPPESLQPPPNLAVVDVSFISLKKVLPKVTQLLSGEGQVPEALLKPQFEYRDYCSLKGFKGVVTRVGDLRTILQGVTDDLTALLPGWHLVDLSESPIQGPKGNREFLIHLRQMLERLLPEEIAHISLPERIEQLLCNDS